MPKLSWTDMIEMYPAGHLVVGIVAGSTAIASRRLVAKLLEGCGLKGDYSLTTAKDESGPTIHIVLAMKEDADEFADTVEARPVGRYPGWASQRAFIIDEGTRHAISDVLEATAV